MVEQHIEQYDLSVYYAINNIRESMADHMERGWIVKCMETVGNYLLVVYERQYKKETSNKNID